MQENAVNRLIKCKLVYIVLSGIVLFSLNPAPVHAWSAVTVELESNFPLVRLWNFFRDIVSSFTGKESPQVTLSDKGTHQLMMKLAYQLLEKDPAYVDQKEYFPTIDGILEWEGVVAKTDRVILEGGEWRGRDAKSGGPDAAGKSKDSNHYYNPRTGKGAANKAVETCFKELLLQMYGQGDFFNRDKPDDDTNHSAAWAAHYLGDLYVPYHTVGAFTTELSAGILSAEEAGPEFLYTPYECQFIDGRLNCDSMEKPPEWNGLNNDFTDIYSYFRRYRSNPDKDWFDPWYYNGIKGLGPNTVLGSHQLWESWAHGYIVDGNLAKSPTSYSKDWMNTAPEFNQPLTHIENQTADRKSVV